MPGERVAGYIDKSGAVIPVQVEGFPDINEIGVIEHNRPLDKRCAIVAAHFQVRGIGFFTFAFTRCTRHFFTLQSRHLNHSQRYGRSVGQQRGHCKKA
ncbi:hypothetical protein D3C84_1141730 [compost metagenome]